MIRACGPLPVFVTYAASTCSVDGSGGAEGFAAGAAAVSAKAAASASRRRRCGCTDIYGAAVS